MTKKYKQYFLTVSGLIILAIGLILIKILISPQGIIKVLPYICIGVGCGIFGHGLGEVISNKSLKGRPDLEKQLQIQKNDERNITITNRSKAKAYDMMVYVYGALLLSFALMGVDISVVLLLVFGYLFVVGYGIYYRCKFDREM